MSDYSDLARFIVEHIVSDKEAVVVESEPRGRAVVVEVTVADDDMGKIIGKGGRNIEAIRSIMRAAGLRHHERVQFELTENDRHKTEFETQAEEEFSHNGAGESH